ncbi:general transcription factor 3C polypeptide 6 isoform X2 [Rhinatrema bivittatum]|uniref:general transcription factor 3C polypeptide 6 isoform X2 n=1 Tax=Rhinatrema bivittatum TaxID=194408 RepID=UPI00112DF840|nr:general transcription factor 3C polypeptide 6 isoform X2 [Rhinatrema bivittatum]
MATSEQLVVVELSGIIDTDFLEKCENQCKILGIDTAKPILQVGKYVFAGEYADALGTCVVFEEDPDHVEASTDSSSKPKLKYKCHTVRKLNMTRTFLTEKEGEGSEGGVEIFQIKDNDFSQRPNMICNFLQHKEEIGAVPLTQEQSIEESEEEEEVVGDGGNLDLSYELENSEHEMEGSGAGLESESCAPSQAVDLSPETALDG